MISGFQNFLHLTLGLPNGWAAREQFDGFIPESGRVKKKQPVKKRKPDELRAEIKELLALPARKAEQQRRLERLILLLVIHLDD